MMKRVLSTKQLTEEELIHARSLSLEIVCVEVIATHSLPFTTPESHTYDAVAFTSVNALKYFLSVDQTSVLLKDKAIFCIEGKTKYYVQEQGYSVSECAENSGLLAARIIDSGIKSVLHPCSKIRLHDMELALTGAGMTYIPLPIYDTQQLAVGIDTKNYAALLFYSPSGVDSFLKNNLIPRKAICCCVGETTANYLKSKGIANEVLYPETPSISAMLSLTASQIK